MALITNSFAVQMGIQVLSPICLTEQTECSPRATLQGVGEYGSLKFFPHPQEEMHKDPHRLTHIQKL